MSYMCVRWLPHGNGEEVIRVRPHWPVRALQLVVGLHVVSMIEREVNRGASAERNGGKLQKGSPGFPRQRGIEFPAEPSHVGGHHGVRHGHVEVGSYQPETTARRTCRHESCNPSTGSQLAGEVDAVEGGHEIREMAFHASGRKPHVDSCHTRGTVRSHVESRTMSIQARP